MASSDREKSFVALYERHYPAVLAYAGRRTDPGSARDVAAETFLVAWRRGGDPANLQLPWLYRTASLTLRNADRADRRQSRTAGRLAAQPPGVVPDPADAVTEADADAARIRQALSALSEADREVLTLTAWEHLEPDEVAVAIGCSRATTAVRLHRARQRFRSAFDALTPEPAPIRSSTPATRKAGHESRTPLR